MTWLARQLKSYSKDGTNVTYTYDADGLRGSKTVNGVKSVYKYVNGQLRHENRSGHNIYYYYDSYGYLMAIRYYTTDSDSVIYYAATNTQGDVLGLYTGGGILCVTYEYDSWGNLISMTDTTSVGIGSINPIRYRGYYFDSETGLYYLQSRYYDPQVGRFINSDGLIDTRGIVTQNVYSYCANNPVSRKDINGFLLDTVFDVLSLGVSIVEVCVNPLDPWAWAGLVGDTIDLIPFVTGVGELTRAAKTTVKVVDEAADVIDTAKNLYKAADAADDIRKATGSYEILYKSGKNYVGKGGFKRAITSASKTRRTNNVVDEVISISWKSAPDSKTAFMNEYLMQKLRGVLSSNRNAKTYNKIWSPGRNYYFMKYGRY